MQATGRRNPVTAAEGSTPVNSFLRITVFTPPDECDTAAIISAIIPAGMHCVWYPTSIVPEGVGVLSRLEPIVALLCSESGDFIVPPCVVSMTPITWEPWYASVRIRQAVRATDELFIAGNLLFPRW
jgi:hypothetical protein